MSLPRLAEHFGVARTTVHKAVARGEVPSFRIGTLYRVRLSEVPEHVIARWRADRSKPAMPPGDKVYFISADHGSIKIGLSRDPFTRLARLNTSSPVPLRLLAFTPGGAELERQYHKRFAAHRLHGEWFSPHPDILAEIDRLNAQVPA